MLKIFNELRVFIEDCYERFNIRQYAKLRNISPPTASRLLQRYYKEGLLKKEAERRYLFYRANRENKIFIDLSRIYWRSMLETAGLLEHMNKELNHPAIVLFGSLSKAETMGKSDMDLAVFSRTKKELILGKYEKKMKRKIQLFIFQSLNSIKNEELKKNILNGYIISGRLK